MKRDIGKILRHRARNDGRHLHHRDCIHNLTPEDQIEMHGKTVDWWMTVIGRMPEQITRDQWECESPIRDESTPPTTHAEENV